MVMAWVPRFWTVSWIEKTYLSSTDMTRVKRRP